MAAYRPRVSSVLELGRMLNPLAALYWRHHDDCGQTIYENGVFKPKELRQVQARTGVEVLIPTQSPTDDDPTGWAAARALIGFIDDAPGDMAEHHDHRLYGRPPA